MLIERTDIYGEVTTISKWQLKKELDEYHGQTEFGHAKADAAVDSIEVGHIYETIDCSYRRVPGGG